MQSHMLDEDLRLAEALVAEAHANGGLAPVDLERFWSDQAEAARDPFSPKCPQCAMGAMISWEAIFGELGLDEDPLRYSADEEWRLGLHKAYNDRAAGVVGQRPFLDTPGVAGMAYPAVKGLSDIFEARSSWSAGSWWLEQSAHSEDELQGLLDRVEERIEPGHLRSFILPGDWELEKQRLLHLGVKPGVYRHQRGPITFATSIYGVENLIFLLYDNPDLARRFSDVILRAMLGLARVTDEEAGYAPEEAPRGFSFADDNCYLMTADMYEFFGYPVLKGMFERYSPNPGDSRFQHSDSPMGHLLPLLGSLNLTGTNFGPTLSVAEIRRFMPRAIIQGQLAPFTYSRNDEVGLVAEFLRDFRQAREHRGLVYTTAGSINNGSRLTGMRLVMAAIQRYGRYGA